MKDTDGDEADPIGMAGPRFLAAYGRDVDLIAEGLAFDSATGGLILTGKGKAATSAEDVVQKIKRVLAGESMNFTALRAAVGGNSTKTGDDIRMAVSAGHIFKVGNNYYVDPQRGDE
jgi:hypothetical protein